MLYVTYDTRQPTSEAEDHFAAFEKEDDSNNENNELGDLRIQSIDFSPREREREERSV